MPAQKPISREYRIYLALWRKALKQDEIVRINCSDRNMAIAMRQGMYRAIRPFRYGQLQDHELITAAEKFVVFLGGSKEDNSGWLELRPRLTLSEMEGMFDDLGIDEEDLLLGDERAANQSLQKLLASSDPAEAPRKTTYYERED